MYTNLGGRHYDNRIHSVTQQALSECWVPDRGWALGAGAWEGARVVGGPRRTRHYKVLRVRLGKNLSCVLTESKKGLIFALEDQNSEHANINMF